MFRNRFHKKNRLVAIWITKGPLEGQMVNIWWFISGRQKKKLFSVLLKATTVVKQRKTTVKWQILTDTGENVQKWTRVFATRRWLSYSSLGRVGKKETKIERPILDVFACGQVSSPRLYRLKGNFFRNNRLLQPYVVFDNECNVRNFIKSWYFRAFYLTL